MSLHVRQLGGAKKWARSPSNRFRQLPLLAKATSKDPDFHHHTDETKFRFGSLRSWGWLGAQGAKS